MRETFEQVNAQARETLVGEFVGFLRDTKKWWLLPILLMLGLISLLAVLAGSGAAPFLYTLF